MKIKLYLAGLILVSTALFTGCTKEGPTGPQGPAGLNGYNGVANISTSTYTAIPGAWNFATPWYYIALSVPDITDANNDLVNVYLFYNSEWWAIPSTDIQNPGDSWQYSFSNGSLTLWYKFTSAPATTNNFKIVVIPPAMKKKDVDYRNYQSVKNAYNLND